MEAPPATTPLSPTRWMNMMSVEVVMMLHKRPSMSFGLLETRNKGSGPLLSQGPRGLTTAVEVLRVHAETSDTDVDLNTPPLGGALK